MIRPVTLVCWILALSAGLYLYRAKHEVELMDQHIDQIAKQTADLRVESRGLLDEWIRLGEPEQLHRYSDEYLGLQPISPGQFARLGDLTARLPSTQPDPPEEQVDVVAQSSGAPAADSRSSGDPAGAAQADPAESATAASDWANASANDIPIPPIPPVKAPVVAAVPPAAIALPLQARPVTPRLADGQPEPETARTRTGTVLPAVDEPHNGTARVTPAALPEPHQVPPGPMNGQAAGQPGGQAHGSPPLQARAPRDVPGSPPLQAQVRTTREAALGPGRDPVQSQPSGRGQAQGQPEPLRETRSGEPQPTQHQTAEPRNPGTQIGRPGPAQTEQAQMAPAPGTSLLGMSRGSVPLPLPAPTPVNANWSGPAGTGSLGSGR